MKKLILLALLLLPFQAQATPLPVVASFSILGDLAQQVGGPDVSVKTLIGPDSDAHSYEPAPADVATVASAKVIIINGLGFEGWMPRLAAASGFKGRMITASDGVTPRHMPDGSIDPHAWQNPQNGLIYVDNIAKALGDALPDRKAEIEARAILYKDKIHALDEHLHAAFAAIPENRRHIITSHDAFGYFGDAYGITFMAPAGLNTEAEPSIATMAALTRQIRQENIRIIFLENITSPRFARQLAKETSAALGDTLYSDALSGPNGPAPSYLAMFDYNAGKLRQAMMNR